MTQSVYIIGGAGAGKSTFTAELTARMDLVINPNVIALYSLPNKKNVVTLRGQRLHAESLTDPTTGLYLGIMRDKHPGTDGLDRASSPVGEQWLARSDDRNQLPSFIIGEGATLATRRFITALDDYTNLLLVHLHVDPVVADLRFAQRGSSQDDSFTSATVTRSANLYHEMCERPGHTSISVDTESRDQWISALNDCVSHLRNP